MRPKLSILIPSYNMAGKIDRCLAGLYGFPLLEWNFEVVVFDSSDDNSMAKLLEHAKKHDNLTILHSDRKTSIGVARNLAFRESKGEYVFCLDIDDRFIGDALERMISKLDGKDLYFCPYVSKKDGVCCRFSKIESAPVAAWTKVYKREFYVDFPDYMPEDVVAHYLLLDKVNSVAALDFPVVEYDNTPENKGAVSRTFDYLKDTPSNLMSLAVNDTLKSLNLNDEYVAGVVHNLADLYAVRNRIKKPEVKAALMKRLGQSYLKFMSGIYTH
ncbi:glycosyltransferase family 2 protein [Fibrobacter sp.]|uniref:glycosyltransferase family 2 protein n=1 Tax=Fibrobacter sp. TaxID=35828 RepID=UPI003890B5E5